MTEQNEQLRVQVGGQSHSLGYLSRYLDSHKRNNVAVRLAESQRELRDAGLSYQGEVLALEKNEELSSQGKSKRHGDLKRAFLEKIDAHQSRNESLAKGLAVEFGKIHEKALVPQGEEKTRGSEYRAYLRSLDPQERREKFNGLRHAENHSALRMALDVPGKDDGVSGVDRNTRVQAEELLMQATDAEGLKRVRDLSEAITVYSGSLGTVRAAVHNHMLSQPKLADRREPVRT